ncbi:predicted protein, partial [Nematostella vectensis]
CTYAGVLWYYHHLHEKMPLVMVTSSEEVIERYNGRTMGVFVMSMSDYISGFYPGLTSVHELFESLSTAIAVADSNTGESTDAEDSGNSSDVMMTGHVVGVLQRNWRDYVVSFAEDVVRTAKMAATPCSGVFSQWKALAIHYNLSLAAS